MPPRKTAKRPPVQNRRRSTSKKNQKQMSAGILLIFVPLIVFSIYLMLRNSGPDKPAPTPVKTSAPQKENHMKDLDTLAPPPEPLYQKEAPKKEDQPENAMKDSPEVTGQPDQTKDNQAQEAQPQEQKQPEPKVVEKTVETISAVNAIKLFMFDQGLNQSIMTQHGTDISLRTDSDKHAATLKANLKNYLIKNKLSVTSSRPLRVKDSYGEYTISFNVEKPKPAPQVKQEPKPKTEAKPQTKPKQTVKPAAPKPSVQKPTPKPTQTLPRPPAATKPAAQAEPKPASFKAKLALVIDDCGYNTDLARKATGMGYPVTLAVIPYTPYASETARIAKATGNTLFLHFPMQPQSYPAFDPGKGAVLVNMPEQIIASVTRADVESLGVSIDGANNHTGSAFTEDMDKMTQTLSYLKNYTSRFLDSRTSGGSQAYAACRKVGMRCGANSLFLDNESPNVTSDGGKESHVHDELMLAGKMALSRGSVIVIGHLRKTTVAAFPAALADLERMGVKIVPVTQLMN